MAPIFVLFLLQNIFKCNVVKLKCISPGFHHLGNPAYCTLFSRLSLTLLTGFPPLSFPSPPICIKICWDTFWHHRIQGINCSIQICLKKSPLSMFYLIGPIIKFPNPITCVFTLSRENGSIAWVTWIFKSMFKPKMYLSTKCCKMKWAFKVMSSQLYAHVPWYDSHQNKSFRTTLNSMSTLPVFGHPSQAINFLPQLSTLCTCTCFWLVHTMSHWN